MDAILSHNTLQYRFLVQVWHGLNYVELMFNVAAIKDGRTCKLQSVQSFRSSSRTATGTEKECMQTIRRGKETQYIGNFIPTQLR